MSKFAFAGLYELVEIAGLIVGTGLFSWIGFHLETLGFTAITGGDVRLGLWMTGMGALALYVGIFLIGYETLLPRVAGDAGSEPVDGGSA